MKEMYGKESMGKTYGRKPMKKTYGGKLIVALLLCCMALLCSASVPMAGQKVHAATKIQLSKKTATITKGKSLTLKLKGTKKKAKWSSSSKKVATVNQAGKVTAKKAGKTKVTAKVGSKKYTCSVTVVEPVELSKKAVTLTEGKSTTLKLKGTKEKVMWSSGNKVVATVSQKGKVTAKKAGKTKITAKAGKKKYTCTVTVVKAQTGQTDPGTEQPTPGPEQPDPEHKHDYKFKKDIKATCTEDGYKLYECSCGLTEKRYYTDALGHVYGDAWYITKEPTENENGTAKKICARCDAAVGEVKDIAFTDLYKYIFRDGGAVITNFARNYYADEIHIPSTL